MTPLNGMPCRAVQEPSGQPDFLPVHGLEIPEPCYRPPDYPVDRDNAADSSLCGLRPQPSDDRGLDFLRYAIEIFPTSIYISLQYKDVIEKYL
jgi:hypothetical protein